jgi:hypothetical protein
MMVNTLDFCMLALPHALPSCKPSKAPHFQLIECAVLAGGSCAAGSATIMKPSMPSNAAANTVGHIILVSGCADFIGTSVVRGSGEREQLRNRGNEAALAEGLAAGERKTMRRSWGEFIAPQYCFHGLQPATRVFYRYCECRDPFRGRRRLGGSRHPNQGSH